MKQLFSLLPILFLNHIILAQEGVGIGITTPHPSAVLHVQSASGNKGMLIPRLSSGDRLNISPPTDANGLLVYDTDQRSLYHFDGDRWHQVGSPAGTIVMWSGTAIPQGWALCNGRWYNPNDNTDNGTIATTSRTVYTPNLSGRFVVGFNPLDADYNNPGNISTGLSTPGETGGLESVTLTTNQMPNHNHTMDLAGDHSHTMDFAGSHRHNMNSVGDDRLDGVSTVRVPQSNPDFTSTAGGFDIDMRNAGNHRHIINANGDHTHTINNEGGGAAHENRPPYYVLAYIMKL